MTTAIHEPARPASWQRRLAAGTVDTLFCFSVLLVMVFVIVNNYLTAFILHTSSNVDFTYPGRVLIFRYMIVRYFYEVLSIAFIGGTFGHVRWRLKVETGGKSYRFARILIRSVFSSPTFYSLLLLFLAPEHNDGIRLIASILVLLTLITSVATFAYSIVDPKKLSLGDRVSGLRLIDTRPASLLVRREFKHRARRTLTLKAILSLSFALICLVVLGVTGRMLYVFCFLVIAFKASAQLYTDNSFQVRHFSNVLGSTSEQVLPEIVYRARDGFLPISNPQSLALDFAETMRTLSKDVGTINYCDLQGNMAGAGAEPNDSSHRFLYLRTADGVLSKSTLDEQNKLSPVTDSRLIPGDPRKQEWFAKTLASTSVQWAKSSTLSDGTPVLTSAVSWTPPRATQPAGVFFITFYVTKLDAEVARAASFANTDEFVALIDPDGNLISASKDDPERKQIVQQAVTMRNKSAESKNETRFAVDGPIPYVVIIRDLHATNAPLIATAIPTTSLSPGNELWAIFSFAIALGTVIAMIIGRFIAQLISDPLVDLSEELRLIGDFNLESGRLSRSIVQEIQILTESSELMKTGLRSFLRYVPGDLVRLLLQSGKEAALGGELREATILLSDIQGFTAYSENRHPEALVTQLSSYFNILADQVKSQGGTLDKFIGDGMLAFYNAPFDLPKHEQAACLTALQIQEELVANDNPFTTRVGLHSGTVLVGNIGTSERFAYTVIGDVVNTTSRLESLNKAYGSSIIASHAIQSKTEGDLEWRRLDRVAVVGRSGALDIYQLLGRRKSLADHRLCARDLYQSALLKYFQTDFAEARSLFLQAASHDPTDLAAPMMARRCEAMSQTELGADWNGVFAQKEK